MMRTFWTAHVDRSWYEDYWYGEQGAPKRRSWKAVAVAMLMVLLGGSNIGAQ